MSTTRCPVFSADCGRGLTRDRSVAVVAVDPSLEDRGANIAVRPSADEAPHQFGSGKMAETEEADEFVLGETLPGAAASPGKASGFDGRGREALTLARLDLLAQPAQVDELVLQRGARIFADDDSGDVRKIQT